MFERVVLENIRLHVKSDIPLSPGVTAICGFNGAGKSTILEGIKFAMGDVLSCTREEFVNEKAKTGRVSVTFKSRADGKSYVVERVIGSGGKWSACRLDGGVFPGGESEVSGKDAMIPFLKHHLGLSPEASLQVVFQESVGVEQGMVAVPFSMPASIRRKLFGPLLCVDKYENAWRAMAAMETELHRKASAIMDKAGAMSGDISELRDARREAREIARSVRKADARISAVGLESLGKKADRAGRLFLAEEAKVKEAMGAAADLDAAKSDVSRTEADESRAMAAVRICRANRDIRKSHLEAIAKVSALDNAMKDLASAKAAVSEAEALIREAGSSLTKDAARLSVLEKMLVAEDKVLSDAGKEKALLSSIQAAREAGVRQEAARRKFESAEKRLSVAMSDRDRLLKAKTVSEACVAKAAVLAELASRAREGASAAGKSLGGLEERGKAVKDNLAKLSGAGGKCPLCLRPMEDCDKKESVLALEAEIGIVRDEYRKARTLSADLSAKAERFDRLATVLVKRGFGKSGAESLKAAVSAVSAVSEELRLAKVEIDSFKPADMDKLVADHSLVKGSVEKAASLAATRSEADAIGKRMAETEARVAAARKIVGKGVDQSLVRASEDREKAMKDAEETLPGYRAFEKAFPQAVRAGQTRKALRDGYSKLERLRIKAAGLESARKAAAKAGEDMDLANGKLESGRAEVMAIRERRAADLERARAAAGRIDRLLALLDKAEALKVEGREAKRVADEYAFVRETIRRTGPEMVKSLTRLISHGATAIFSDLTGYDNCELSWDSDYGISMVKDGATRKFRQLSGGQAMAAALSVRLAAMREVSGMDVVFCDEPTPHMDKPSRENLAKQIVHLSGFSQVFVISHDDTFEVNVDNVIRVEEGENGSVVTIE